MRDAMQTILVVHSDPATRATLARQLASSGRTVLEAGDGTMALQMVQSRKVRLMVTELYVRAGDSDCLVQAVRRNRVRGLRTLALTTHRTNMDRDWARRWGASGFVIQPATPERVQYVVTRLLTSSAAKATPRGRIARRDTLDGALGDIERGTLRGTRSIVIGRPWWDGLAESERTTFRQRARHAKVSLRSDAMMSPDFVEVRRAKTRSPEASAKASPYRG